MDTIHSYEVSEQYENTLTVYVNNIIVAYVSNRKVKQIRSVRKLIDRVLLARDRSSKIVPTFTYNQLYSLTRKAA